MNRGSTPKPKQEAEPHSQLSLTPPSTVATTACPNEETEGPHMSRRTLYRRILLPLAAVTPHFLASTSDMPSPPLVTEKQQFLELSTSPIHPLGGNRVLTSFVRFCEGLEFGESRFLRSSVGSGRELGEEEDVNVDLTEHMKASDVEIPSESITSKLSKRSLNSSSDFGRVTDSQISSSSLSSMSIIVTTTITITFNAPISISSFSASVSEAVSATITKTSAAVTIIFISTSSFSTPSSNSVSTTLFIYPLIKASSFPGFDFMDREEEVELIMGLVVVLVPVVHNIDRYEGAGYEEAVMVEMEQSKKKKKRKREKERRQRRKEDDEDGGGGATKQDNGKKEAV
ncbi:hypothetical protein Bca52824_038390 [Brassica carinata]|uniref:Uncharacterized protein n=1 Tax=Brassica carinata TaxID=52824 RepID=A0A8X7UVY2_BRACI|nr:hypothetical protein Bca52824_038390 [Brassica carinata]